MLKTYIKIALRVLFRNRKFSLINIFGLAFSLTCSLLIFVYTSNELSFDKYHEDYSRVHRVVSNEQNENGIDKSTSLPFPIVRTIEDNVSGIEEVVFIYAVDNCQITIGDNKFNENGMLYSSSDITDIFTIEIIAGDTKGLDEPNKVLLSENTAIKYFGTSDVLGKEILVDNTYSFEIVGVVKDAPYNMHLPYRIIASESSMNDELVGFDYDRWNISIGGFTCYIKTMHGVNVSHIEDELNKAVRENTTTDNKDKTYLLQEISKIHLSDDYSYVSAMEYTNNVRFIITLSIIGLFILVVACINFINLSTVQALKRAKEIGIRKLLGANRKSIILQNLGETFIVVLISEIIAIIFSEVLWTKLANLFQITTEISIYSNIQVFYFLVIILIVVSLVSGLYPAFTLSRFLPAKTLKSNTINNSTKKFTLRNFLVTFQFVISQLLIISAVFIALQIKFVNNKDLGFRTESVWNINLPINDNSKYETLKTQLESLSEIEKVAYSLGGPLSGANINTQFSLEGTELWGNVNLKPVNVDYNDVFEMNLLVGRWINHTNESDSIYECVVNEKLIEVVNIESPLDAIGSIIDISRNPCRIVGVVDNFNITDLKEDISAVALSHYSRFFITASFIAEMNDGLKSKIENVWDDVYPDYILEVESYQDNINNLYKNEQNTFKMILFFSVIAIVIACLGLYGLVSYIVIQRTKEISIRKVLGAPVLKLMFMVTKQFISLVGISCLIAWPLSYYLINKWLQGFAFRIDIQMWVFLLSGIALAIISFITILNQAIKVARLNPANTLKYE